MISGLPSRLDSKPTSHMVAAIDLLDRAFAAWATLGFLLHILLARFLFLSVGFLSLPMPSSVPINP
jgi:hypothetical protein